VDGILKRILVDEGSPIHTGMLLAEIPEVKSFYYVQGYGVYHNRAMMFLNLKPKAQRKKKPGGCQKNRPRQTANDSRVESLRGGRFLCGRRDPECVDPVQHSRPGLKRA